MPDPGPAAVTHDGGFHADDAMAAAMLRILHPGLALRRTRDPGAIAAADIVFDVGGAYDPGRARYDHHMRGPPARPDGRPYAACGLVWLHHGEAIVARLLPDEPDPGIVRAVAASLAEGLVAAIDAVDTGNLPPAASDLASLGAALSPMPGEEAEGDALFAEAEAIARRFLGRQALREAEAERSVARFARAASSAADARIVALDRPMPWKRAVRRLGLREILYVVHPDGAGREWMCAAVPDHEAVPYALRKPLPGAWAGLRDAAFAECTGVADAAFCHPNRFLCGAGSRAGAMRLAAAAASDGG